MTRVLIVEDDPAMRARLTEAIAAEDDLEVFGTAGSLEEAGAELEKGSPDVLITDLGLPDGSGVELIHRVAGGGGLCMVVTVFGDEKNVLRAISAGASSYLLKDTPTADLAPAVRQLLAGGSPISPSIARHILRRFQGAKPTADVVLTEREAEVLRLIAKGFTYAEIADLLDLSSHTVTSHVRKIYRKLSVGSRGEAVYEAVQLGLLELD